MQTGCSTSMTHAITAPLLTNMGALMREGDACIGRKVRKCKKGFSETENVMEALAFLDLAPLFLSMVAVRRKMEHSCDSTERSEEQKRSNRFEGSVAAGRVYVRGTDRGGANSHQRGQLSPRLRRRYGGQRYSQPRRWLYVLGVRQLRAALQTCARLRTPCQFPVATARSQAGYLRPICP